MATVLDTFRGKCSLLQSEYVGCNFGTAVPGKEIGFGAETVGLSLS